MDSQLDGVPIGSVAGAWRYPVKSLQGMAVNSLEIDATGVDLDRAWGLIDRSSGKVMTAKRTAEMLNATATDQSLTLPNGDTFDFYDPQIHSALSTWLSRDIRFVSAAEAGDVSYEMTFDPPNEDAEVFDIPTPTGTLVDLAPLHIVTSSTKAACEEAYPELDWNIRRFRPNLLLDLAIDPWEEQTWVGTEIAIGSAVLRFSSPMVRCAMPLRAQPGGIQREPALFKAMSELNPLAPNHFGMCCDVTQPGRVELGDQVYLSYAHGHG